ncbi:MAG: 3,4-dihydroxy-2-butanone-4-phosphate synthase [Candidatus Hodarchaeaceae archaeon]|nr:3,4-dihydroxy-2-butanone-4-phosphate synthase [Candidatus Hodarchaeaceae archaeon]
MSIDRALEELRAGNFVLIHDASNREDEVDMVIAAEAVKPAHIAAMRRDAGGLICVALHPRVADNFGLPYMTEIYDIASSRYHALAATKPNDLPYDERSAFSISVNHRQTRTGVTDIDRALTISELGKLGARALNGPMAEEFGRNFRSPGHVPILRAADGLVLERQGHTELAMALAEMADITPVMAICEMLDAQTNRALSWKAAVEYAEMRGFACLSGKDVMRAYRGWVG